MDAESLLGEAESEWLDRKACHHEDTLSLLHDILCLVNAWAESDLLFGVGNDGRVTGVEKDSNRRKEAHIQDLLRQADLSRIPTVSVRTRTVQGPPGGHPDRPEPSRRTVLHDEGQERGR